MDWLSILVTIVILVVVGIILFKLIEKILYVGLIILIIIAALVYFKVPIGFDFMSSEENPGFNLTEGYSVAEIYEEEIRPGDEELEINGTLYRITDNKVISLHENENITFLGGLENPKGIAYHKRYFYIVDENKVIKAIDDDGDYIANEIRTIATILVENGEPLVKPMNIDVSVLGDILITDKNSNKVYRIYEE